MYHCLRGGVEMGDVPLFDSNAPSVYKRMTTEEKMISI